MQYYWLIDIYSEIIEANGIFKGPRQNPSPTARLWEAERRVRPRSRDGSPYSGEKNS
jgi:hypothetical protein